MWSSSLGSIAKGVLTRGKSVKRLELPAGIGDGAAPDGVVATALMPDLHVIPGLWSVSIGYDAMLRWFRSTFDLIEADPADPQRAINFVPFPYDWRLSNRTSARELQRTVEPVLERFRAQPGHADAKLVFVGHSMGGLVARYYVDVLGGHELTRKVITLGTPHRGALNALTTLVNGIAKGVAPLRFDLTHLARSLPSLHQLLPDYACIETPEGLRATTEIALPEVGTVEVADARRFHEELRAGAAAHAGSYDSHPIISRTQPTDTTARLVGGRIEPLRTIDGRDELGDGTVPRLSAAPYGVASSDPILRYVMEKHGGLPANDPVQVELEGILTASDVIVKASEFDVGVICDDVIEHGDPIAVTIEAAAELVVESTVQDGAGTAVGHATAVDRGDGTYGAQFDALGPGLYTVRVGVRGARDVVTTPVAVLPDAEIE